MGLRIRRAGVIMVFEWPGGGVGRTVSGKCRFKVAMQAFPSFNAAVDKFKDVLSENGQPNDIQWVFRDNV